MASLVASSAVVSVPAATRRSSSATSDGSNSAPRPGGRHRSDDDTPTWSKASARRSSRSSRTKSGASKRREAGPRQRGCGVPDLVLAAQPVEDQRRRGGLRANREVRQDHGHAAGVLGAEAAGEGEAFDPVDRRRVGPIAPGDDVIEQGTALRQVDEAADQHRAEGGQRRGLADPGEAAQHQEVEIADGSPPRRRRSPDRAAMGDFAKSPERHQPAARRSAITRRTSLTSSSVSLRWSAIALTVAVACRSSPGAQGQAERCGRVRRRHCARPADEPPERRAPGRNPRAAAPRRSAGR